MLLSLDLVELSGCTTLTNIRLLVLLNLLLLLTNLRLNLSFSLRIHLSFHLRDLSQLLISDDGNVGKLVYGLRLLLCCLLLGSDCGLLFLMLLENNP